MLAQMLVDDVEALPHRDRVRRLVRIGRRAASGDPEARDLVAALRAGDTYARTLALFTAFGSRDADHVLAALSDPSRTLRRRAAAMVALVCDDAQAVSALRTVEDPLLRAKIAGNLRRRKRLAPLDAWLRGAEEETDRVPTGSLALVTEQRERLVAKGSPVGWQRLASRHPAWTVAELRASLAATKNPDQRLEWRLSAVLPRLVTSSPHDAIALVTDLLDRGEDPRGWRLRGPLARLAVTVPEATFDALKRRHGVVTAVPAQAFDVVRFDKVARRLGAERLAWLVEHAWHTLGDGKAGRAWYLSLDRADRAVVLDTWLRKGRGSWGAFLLRYASGDAKEAAYKRWTVAARASDGTIHDTVLDWLPDDLRHREARRHLRDVPAIAEKPERRLPYARLLPFAEAQAELAPFLGHPEGDERAKALRIVIATIRHDHAALGAALALVKSRRFEQDPVRAVMVDGLATLPERVYAVEHLDDVGAVVQAALDAADLSPGTAAACERLVIRQVRVDAAWAAVRLGSILEIRGSLTQPFLTLSPGETEAIGPVLAELAARWTDKERAHAVLWLARGLGIRLGAVPGVMACLERLAAELPFVGVAAISLELLRRADRDRFARYVPDLLVADRSFVVLPAIARHLSLSRQDLLEPFLSDRPMTGRFATGRTRWVLDFGLGFARWTGRQQAMHADAWSRALDGEGVDVPTARAALNTLGRLAYTDPAHVLRRADDRRPPVREMAVRALPWLDGGQGVPVLVECLGDDRARWAIYALRVSFREMSRPKVLAQLRAVPTTKVTVAKEVVRLLGSLGGAEGYGDLLAMDRPDLHRDVRIALLRALWDHLDREPTWAMFERAAADPDWVIASRLADVPAGTLSPESERRLTALLVKILGRAEPEARLDLLKRAAALPLRDAERILMGALLDRARAADPDEAAAAWNGALARIWPAEVEKLTQAFHDARSRPRRLLALVEATKRWMNPYMREDHRKVAAGILRDLREDPRWVTVRIGLAGNMYDWKRLASVLEDASAAGLLHADAVAAALPGVSSSAHAELIEAKLASAADPNLRRLAVAGLAAAAGPERGWTSERRARLVRYRADAAPLVAGAASLVLLPEE